MAKLRNKVFVLTTHYFLSLDNFGGKYENEDEVEVLGLN
jgi:hypothetical protein